MNSIYPFGLPIALSLVGYNSILTGFFALLKRRDKVGFQYFVFSFAVFLWGIGVSFMLNNDLSKESAEWWGRFSQAAALFIPVTWFHFVLVYTNELNTRRKILYFFYFLTLIISPFSFTSHYISGFRRVVEVNHYPIPGPFYVAFTVLFVVTVTLTFSTLFKSFVKEKSKERKADYQRLFVANLYGFLTGSLSFLPVYGIKLPQYNLLIMPLWQFLLAYAMVRYSLLDLEEVARAVQREKLATIGTLAASLNHEIRNPLYIIKTLSESFLERKKESTYSPSSVEEKKKEIEEIFSKILDQIARAFDIVKRFSEFAKPRPASPIPERLNLNEILDNVLTLVRYQIEMDKIQVQKDVSRNVFLNVDKIQLQQAFLNLIINACQAMSKGGILRIFAQEKGSQLRIEISDTGGGISQQTMKHLFEPFHTTKGENGTGLGLYVTKQLIQTNNGKISIKSQVGKGTIFNIEFSRA